MPDRRNSGGRPSPCPCDEARAYAACCGRWHAGTPAPDAASLMRSRYSAYVLERSDYLLATWHPDTRPRDLDLFAGGRPRWLGLKLRRHEVIGPDEALVEFIARYRIGGQAAVRQHELSRFFRQDGRWYYVDGQMLN